MGAMVAIPRICRTRYALASHSAVDDIPVSVLAMALVILLLLSGIFSMTETSMMAANRFRLRHRAGLGHRGAKLAIALLDRTDRMLGVILLGNNLVNTAAAMLVSIITIQLFGESTLALGAGTLLVTFAILVFSEIAPKIIGASRADSLAPALSYGLTPLLRVAYPVVWFVNLFASGLLHVLHLRPQANGDASTLTPEEMQTLVREAGHLLPPKHQAVLLNLFELGQIAVEDVMTPRGSIEALDLDRPWAEITERLSTSHHTRLVVFKGDLSALVGTIHLRRIAGRIGDPDWTADHLTELIQAPYFVPASTAVLTQLQYFQDNRQRMGIVIDEYGEVLGLVTPEDIIEEMVGEFSPASASGSACLTWDESDSALVEGHRSLREINRRLDLDLPTDGPKTLNGLIIEYLQDIPESGVSLKIGRVPIEIVHTQDRSVKTARIFKPLPMEPRP